MKITRASARLAALLAATLALTGAAHAEFNPDWIARLPTGTALGVGIQAFAVAPGGITYVAGVTGPSGNTDVLTAAFRPDGTLLWSQTYNGPEDWHDQARGITLGPGGVVYVTGNTPGPGRVAKLLLLKYDAFTGALLNSVRYLNTPWSENGTTVDTDAQGNVFVGGGTGGDGSDVLVMKFAPDGTVLWRRTWDGPAFGPFSQDIVKELLVDPSGNADVLIHGVMNSQQPDYVVLEYDTDGTLLWETNWGQNGGDYPREMELDAAGDVYATGIGLVNTDRFGTIKLDGSNGALLWEAYDGVDFHNSVSGVALDGLGGVYVGGSVDPDGDRSNANDDMYTVKRDATTGARVWVHRYGLACKRCGEGVSDVAADSAGNVFISGPTSSPPYMNQQLSFVLDAATGLERDRGVVSGVSTGFLALDGNENLYNAGGSGEITVMKFGSLARPYTFTAANLSAGSQASFTITNGTPGRTQFVAFSLDGTGAVPIAELGITLGIRNPQLLLSAPADPSGTLSFNFGVPPGAAGVPVWLQSAQLGSVSAVLAQVL